MIGEIYMEEITNKNCLYPATISYSKKKLLMYDDNQELLLYKKDYLIIVPGTDFNMDESLEQPFII